MYPELRPGLVLAGSAMVPASQRGGLRVERQMQALPERLQTGRCGSAQKAQRGTPVFVAFESRRLHYISTEPHRSRRRIAGVRPSVWGPRCDVGWGSEGTITSVGSLRRHGFVRFCGESCTCLC